MRLCFEQGFFPKARLDEQRTNLDVLKRNLSSAQSERNALGARQAEGRILAPANAKVTGVNVVEGSVVSPGEIIATVCHRERRRAAVPSGTPCGADQRR
jgi:multidrug efflux pump subunit AcrA (membrane-fusion protein)